MLRTPAPLIGTLGCTDMTTDACICGFSYVRGLAEDEALHRKIHSEYFIGPSVPSVLKTPVLGEIDGYAVHVVDGRSPFDTRRKIAHVAMVAHRSMSAYPAGYDGTVTEDNQRLYVLVERRRVIGFVLSARDTRFWRLRWSEGGLVELLDRNASIHVGHKIGRVWIAAKFQRRGLAKRLLLVASAHLGMGISEMAWEVPFTASGSALVRSVSPSTFFGCGDIQAVRDTISIEPPPGAASQVRR